MFLSHNQWYWNMSQYILGGDKQDRKLHILYDPDLILKHLMQNKKFERKVSEPDVNRGYLQVVQFIFFVLFSIFQISHSTLKLLLQWSTLHQKKKKKKLLRQKKKRKTKAIPMSKKGSSRQWTETYLWTLTYTLLKNDCQNWK